MSFVKILYHKIGEPNTLFCGTRHLRKSWLRWARNKSFRPRTSYFDPSSDKGSNLGTTQTSWTTEVFVGLLIFLDPTLVVRQLRGTSCRSEQKGRKHGKCIIHTVLKKI